MSPLADLIAALRPMGFAIGATLGACAGPVGIDANRLITDAAAWRRPVAIPAPADNPHTAAKAALGAALFADARLSSAGRSCASCHDAARGYSDARPTARALDGAALPRRTPTLWNLAWTPRLMWDGRAGSLEQQALMPIADPREMAGDLRVVLPRLAADPTTAAAFAAAFPDDAAPVTAANLARAIAAWERTLISPPAPFDRWVAGDPAAVSDAAKRGFLLFNGKALCGNCHRGWNFTDNRAHDIGLASPDRGRGGVATISLGRRFKTPGLRELGARAPYMHDGSLPTLEAVVDHYAEHRSRRLGAIWAVPLDTGQRADLVAFLRTLDSGARPPFDTVGGAMPHLCIAPCDRRQPPREPSDAARTRPDPSQS